jgi:hypothetical protein
MAPRTQKLLFIATGAIGVGLAVMMATTEGELGAFPLGLILLSAAGYANGWAKEHGSSRKKLP